MEIPGMLPIQQPQTLRELVANQLFYLINLIQWATGAINRNVCCSLTCSHRAAFIACLIPQGIWGAMTSFSKTHVKRYIMVIILTQTKDSKLWDKIREAITTVSQQAPLSGKSLGRRYWWLKGFCFWHFCPSSNWTYYSLVLLLMHCDVCITHRLQTICKVNFIQDLQRGMNSGTWAWEEGIIIKNIGHPPISCQKTTNF